MEENKQHKRRVRYSGTHPKHYSEKYKEHSPEKYADTVERVIQKGNTPAGMHISIMVKEILEILDIKQGEIGLDATLGYGGHTKAMLEKLNGKGHIYALDIDPIESEKTRERLEKQGYTQEILTIRNINFKNVDEIIAESGKFDFILADLGVSSMQIDNPNRGFSFKVDGELDLRLNPSIGVSAADRINSINREELEAMLVENADEVYAQEIAEAIINYRKKYGRIDTTTKLRKIIEEALVFIPQKDAKEQLHKACQRTFQAIRIDVNNEFEVLYEFLEKLPEILAPNGRAVILTFHSGEDRLVKKSFKKFKQSGMYSEIASDVIRPSGEECYRNPRAKSTKLRWVIR